MTFARPTFAPCLWFDTQAEAAAAYYCDIFKNSRIVNVTHYGEVGFETHGMPAGSVLTVNFEIDGQSMTALNGGPIFKFNEAVSLQVLVDTQEEIDYYWDRLREGGDPSAQQCGWLKDKFGVSWQVSARGLDEMLTDPVRSPAVFAAVMQMKKIDIAVLHRAGLASI